VRGAAKEGSAKAGTRALDSAPRMQLSAGVPTASPETDTSLTLPSDRNVTVAYDGGSLEARQARAARPATPSALWMAPVDGLSGTLSGPPARPDPAATAAAG